MDHLRSYPRLLALLLALVLGIVALGAVFADDPSPPESTESIEAMEATAPLVHPDQNTEGTGPAQFVASEPSRQSSNRATFTRRYAGLAFVPRDSDQTHDYGGNGCIQGKTNGNGLWVHALVLPDGAEITRLTLYFHDTDAGAAVTGWITRFDNQGGFADLVSVSSTGAVGFGSASATLTHPVDNANWSYVLYGRPGTTGATTKFCGLAVDYTVDPGALHIPLLYGDD